MLEYTVWCRLWQDRAGKGDLFFREKLVLEEGQALSCVTVPDTHHLHYFWAHSSGCCFISLSSKGSAAEVGVLGALCCIIRPSQSSVTSPKVS